LEHVPDTKLVQLSEISLDLNNFRTVPQPDEVSAVHAMIFASPDRFWALMASLLEDGYLPTESIIVLRQGPNGDKLVVKEGNRRIAALKLAHKLLPIASFHFPDSINIQITSMKDLWRRENKAVPCTVYDEADAAKVDHIVSLAHGKGEKASRDQWNAVARARHNRARGKNEPALDLLEKYFEHGRNVTSAQKSRWAGAYPLSVLEEAMKRLAPRLGLRWAKAITDDYSNNKHRDGIEGILQDIGAELLTFSDIRQERSDAFAKYGIPVLTTAPHGTSTRPSSSAGTGRSTPASSTSTTQRRTAQTTQYRATAIDDPRAVRRQLREFVPRGKKREKVVALKDEAVRLDLGKTPFAFCFVLRSMFEISAKAYCADHTAAGGPTITKSNGQDKPLADILREITTHLTKNKTDKAKIKELHGAMAELGRTEGFLSVTSMNQLIHHSRFSVTPRDIAVLFANVFPLLEAMNN
jgi:hypothetical protein